MIVRVLGYGVVATALALGGSLLLPGGTGADPSPRADHAPVQTVSTAPSVGALNERPLFDMSRRPVAAQAEPVAVPAAPEPVRISLSGIVGEEEGGFSALFRVSDQPELKVLRPEGQIEGWTVREIGAVYVTLTDAGGQVRQLNLR